jgi:hypothetical protein
MKPQAVEFLLHMALAAAIALVNTLADDGLVDRDQVKPVPKLLHSPGVNFLQPAQTSLSRSKHIPIHDATLTIQSTSIDHRKTP